MTLKILLLQSLHRSVIIRTFVKGRPFLLAKLKHWLPPCNHRRVLHNKSYKRTDSSPQSSSSVIKPAWRVHDNLSVIGRQLRWGQSVAVGWQAETIENNTNWAYPSPSARNSLQVVAIKSYLFWRINGV